VSLPTPGRPKRKMTCVPMTPKMVLAAEVREGDF
jgi:hypothetical protein